MKPWFRVYNSILSDPKLLGLSLENQALFIKYLAVSNLVNAGGMLPKPEIISKMIGQRIDKVRSATRAMIAVGLLAEDVGSDSVTITGWRAKQFESDDPNPRSQKHRKSKCNVAGRSGGNVAKQSPRAGATDTDTDTDTENTPPYPPSSGGRRGPVTVVDSGGPDPNPPPKVDPPGSPGYRAVVDLIPDGWKISAEPVVNDLLSRLPAAGVKYGLQEALEKYDGPFTRKVAGYWRAIAEDNPGGRPPRGPVTQERARGTPPPPPNFVRAEADEIIPIRGEGGRRVERA